VTATKHARGEATAVDVPVVRLAEDQVQDIVDRIVERLAPRLAARGDGLVDAATIARELGVKRATVYAHKDELGAIEIGSGSKPRLRFDRKRAVEGWKSGAMSGEVQAASTTPKQKVRPPGRATFGVRLLPVKGPSSLGGPSRAQTIDRS